MACHELAALRLGMMKTLGIDDEAARQHDIAELGESGNTAGPLASLRDAGDLAQVRAHFVEALSDLDGRVAGLEPDDPQLPYLRTLLVLTKKIELELDGHLAGLKRLWADLDDVHDYVHEIYPAP